MTNMYSCILKFRSELIAFASILVLFSCNHTTNEKAGEEKMLLTPQTANETFIFFHNDVIDAYMEELVKSRAYTFIDTNKFKIQNIYLVNSQPNKLSFKGISIGKLATLVGNASNKIDSVSFIDDTKQTPFDIYLAATNNKLKVDVMFKSKTYTILDSTFSESSYLIDDVELFRFEPEFQFTQKGMFLKKTAITNSDKLAIDKLLENFSSPPNTYLIAFPYSAINTFGSSHSFPVKVKNGTSTSNSNLSNFKISKNANVNIEFSISGGELVKPFNCKMLLDSLNLKIKSLQITYGAVSPVEDILMRQYKKAVIDYFDKYLIDKYWVSPSDINKLTLICNATDTIPLSNHCLSSTNINSYLIFNMYIK